MRLYPSGIDGDAHHRVPSFLIDKTLKLNFNSKYLKIKHLA